MEFIRQIANILRTIKNFIRIYPAFLFILLCILLLFICSCLDNPDKTSRTTIKQPNYALLYNGARIVDTPNTTRWAYGRYKVWILPVAILKSDPTWVIKPGAEPSEAFCFAGNHGTIVIKLAKEIQITSIQIDHLDKAVAVTNRQSAPKNINIYESQDNECYRHLVAFTYNINKEANQLFYCHNRVENYSRYVKVEVTSNWGHPNNTCVYGVRVYGKH